MWPLARQDEEGELREVQRMTKSAGVDGEKTGPGFPFNLLINHANEILTGYSEVFLGGVWKASVPDYTRSTWRAGKKKKKVKHAFEQK